VNRVLRLGYSLILFVHGWCSNLRVLFLEVASGSMQRSTGCYVMCHCQPAAPQKGIRFLNHGTCSDIRRNSNQWHVQAEGWSIAGWWWCIADMLRLHIRTLL
jgi:hypothetical protein